jgi:membrane protein DedA with SNARE-associated domain
MGHGHHEPRHARGRLNRARSLFERFGFVAILIAYFSGPLRAPVAGAAAIAGMARWNFEMANIFFSTRLDRLCRWNWCGRRRNDRAK